MIDGTKRASLDQVASAVPSFVADGPATGCRAIDVRVWHGIDVRILPDRGLDVASSLPRLWQWVHPASGTYALGIEPANCSVAGREADIAAGRMPTLDPGETRTTSLTIRARCST